MAGWHHLLNGHEFEQSLGDGKRQGSLVCCSPWGCKESDTTLANEQHQLSTSQNDTFIAGGDEEKHTEKSPSGSS